MCVIGSLNSTTGPGRIIIQCQNDGEMVFSATSGQRDTFLTRVKVLRERLAEYFNFIELKKYTLHELHIIFILSRFYVTNKISYFHHFTKNVNKIKNSLNSMVIL